MRRAIYIGDERRLQGKSVLIRDDPESRTRGVLAQFDDLATPEAFEWWPFYGWEFKPIPKDDIEEYLL